jgi:hypothetical protein
VRSKVTDVENPVMPSSLREALKDIDGAIATVDDMPEEYRRRAFLFIERAGNAPTEGFRVSNFVQVVRFFLQDSPD